MSFVYFVLLLGGLIFFHELGHFLVARWMGVHVVTFSIGFGPTLFSFKGRQTSDAVAPTEYVIAALPLGGFVRMLGDDPTQEVDERQRDVSFSGKPIWRRFLIVLAGPAFNLLLPFLIFFFLHLSHSELAPSSIGTVVFDGPAWNAGIRPGDRITSIDGDDVDYWWQVSDHISTRPGETFEIGLARGGESLTVEVTPEARIRVQSAELDIVEEQGRIGIAATFVKTVIGVRRGSLAQRAGLKNWDRVVAVNGEKVDRFAVLVRSLENLRDQAVSLSVIRYQQDVDAGALSLSLGEGVIVELPPAADSPMRGISNAESLVHSVVRGSPAQKIGLRRGDRVLSLDGKRFPMWDFLTDTIFSAPKDTSFTLRWERDGDVSRTEPFDVAEAGGGLGLTGADPKSGSGLVIGDVSAGSLGERLALKANDTLTHVNDKPVETLSGLLEAIKAQEGEVVLTYNRRFHEAEFKLAMVKVPAKLQPDREEPIFGASAFSQHGQPDLITNEGILGYALHHCVTKSVHAVKMNFQAIIGLLTGKVPLKELGGPIVIGQLAAETGDRGWGYFFRLMVWLSVSLGLINLLPIPILDGGHILFLAMEGIRRKPVSLRTRQVATYLGFALIIFLMVTAFKNDIEKSFF